MANPNSSALPRAGCLTWTLSILLVAGSMALFIPFLLLQLFYLEEDWRGARSWEKARTEIEAQGGSLDAATFIPVAIPDADNFGTLSVFRTEADPDHPGQVQPFALNDAMEAVITRLPNSKADESSRADGLPFLPRFTEPGRPDPAFLRARLASICRDLDPVLHLSGKETPVELLEILCPLLPELRQENLTHPDCLLRLKYNAQPPINVSFGSLIALIKLNRILIYEERLALYEGKPQLALDNLAIALKLMTGLQKQPLLISGLVAIGLSEMQLLVVQEGLALHAWNDPQLAKLDADLGRYDFLGRGQFWITGDLVAFNLPSENYYEEHRWVNLAELSMLKGDIPTEKNQPGEWEKLTFWLTPKGWFDLDNAAYLRFRLLGTVKLLDPATRRVFPDREKTLFGAWAKEKSFVFWSRPLVNADSFISRAVGKFAFAQVHQDEARLACRLERYRLIHGGYPATLEELEPVYGSNPQDILTGEPYRYQLQPKGTYLLYSLGWNQKDEGGDRKIPASSTPQAAPDWVWTGQPASK